MELLVTVTLSDRLFSLLENKLPNLGRRIEKAVTKEIGAQTRKESTIEVSVATEVPSPELPVESDKQRRVKTDVTEITESATVAEPIQPEPMVPTPPILPEMTPGERIREIMHRTRQRFEGEDYLENTKSEAYKKYHRALNTQFRQIAVTLGYEKPSLIDTDEKIDAFAAECDALIIDENGFISPPPKHPTK